MRFDRCVAHYRLMNEYGITWPFWGDVAECERGDPQLPPRVEQAVLDWAARFNDQYSWESGWPTERAAREHEAQGRRLYDIVSGLLPDGDSLSLDLWETNHRTGL